MPISPKSVNTIFFTILAIAIFTSILTMMKLIYESEIGVDGLSRPSIEAEIVAKSPIGPIYEVSPFLLPITWGAAIGVLIWKGKTKSLWIKQGYDHDTFKLVTGMRGSSTRIQLLNLLNVPKNKLQLAKELGMDWKTIDVHMEMLEKRRLVEELTRIGTSKYYIISEQGKKVLSLLSDDSNSSFKTENSDPNN